MLLGFIIIIFVLFLFVNIRHKNGNEIVLQFKFISENSIKLILFIFFLLAIFIPPISSSNTIILWEEIIFWNYFRAIIILLVCAYLPGANLYKIFYPQDLLSSKLKIEPFLIKITIYPLISFGFLGTIILVFDQLSLIGIPIEITLYIIIVIIFFFDILSQVLRSHSYKLGFNKVNISKYTFIILLLAIGVSTISIGFLLDWEYLISGDPWQAIKFVHLIEDPNQSRVYITKYPNFWSYLSYGLSLMSGLPYININSLLAPFSYLFITSVYLFMKSILFNKQTKYIVFSTILVSIFSGFFINPLAFSLTFVGDFYFIYKSYSIILFFCGLALFFVKSSYNSKLMSENTRFGMFKEIKIYLLASLFLVLSFMTYILPFLIGIGFIFSFCIFSEKNQKFFNTNSFLIFLFCINVFFLIFDLLQNFFLSYMIRDWLLTFFKYEFIIFILEVIPTPIIIYSFFIVLILIIFIINQVFFRKRMDISNKTKKSTIRYSILFRFFLSVFTLFLLIFFVFNFLEYLILDFELSNKFFFFLLLDKIYLYIGFIGILGLYFSYYCFKKSRSLFYRIFAWIIFSYTLAFFSIFLEILFNYPISPENIPNENFIRMNQWFDRIWIYSIPSLCIFVSIGIFELFKKLKNYTLDSKNTFLEKFLKNVIALSIILFSFSGLTITGVLYGNANFRFNKNQINTLEWISENIPIHSYILIGDSFFMGVGVDSITYVHEYFMYDIFQEGFNETQCVEQIEYLITQRIKYALFRQTFISNYLNKTEFTNNILIPQFYNITLFVSGGVSVHSTPYFD